MGISSVSLVLAFALALVVAGVAVDGCFLEEVVFFAAGLDVFDAEG